jgi:hypothetical protein
MSQTPDPNSSPPKSLWGKRIEKRLDNILEPKHQSEVTNILADLV